MRIAGMMALAAVLSLTGCATAGLFSSANLTNVELGEGNFRLIATDVSGEAAAEYLLGFSGSVRGELQTVAMYRLSGSGMLYREAIADLWSNFEADHGSTEGRSLALVNVRFDSDATNVLGLYTKSLLSIRADVVEFAN